MCPDYPGNRLTGSDFAQAHGERCPPAINVPVSFEEKSKGTITPGKLADLVVLGADPHRTDPDWIKDIKVVRTVIGGQTVHSA